jgi:hypothetical protein
MQPPAQQGAPVNPAVRAEAEDALGADLSGVRVHSDRAAGEASSALRARAFTYGPNIFLGLGETQSNISLLAHELTHVVQQRATRPAVRRQPTVGPAKDSAEEQAEAIAQDVSRDVTGAWIVDATPERPGQVNRDDFLREMERLVTAAANDALGPLWSAAGCPYIKAFFDTHRTTDARRLEQIAKRFSGMRNPTSAADYYEPIIERVRGSVGRWRSGGDVSAELTEAGMGQLAPDARGTTPPSLEQRPGILQRLPDGSGPDGPGPDSSRPDSEGRPLDGATRTRMGGTFGEDFSDVKVHSDAPAAQLAARESARALTIGNEIAFAAGEYRPGTVVGDAVLAHELAHVRQQRGARQAAVTAEPSTAVESDADSSAAEALAQLHGPPGARTGTPVRPSRWTSPLRLSSCSSRPDKLPGADRDGRFKGKSVGYVEGISTGMAYRVDFEAEETLGFQRSEEAAIALAAAGGPNGGAITIENGEYVAYRVLQYIPTERPQTLWERQSGMIPTGVYTAPGVVALVTADGAVLRPTPPAPDQRDPVRARQQPFTADQDPFTGFREAFGDEKGSLAGLDKDRLILAFNAALRANALNVLALSEQEVRSKQQLLAGGVRSVSAGEIAYVRATITDLIDVQQRIDHAEAGAMPLKVPSVPGGPITILPRALAPESGVGTVDYALKAAEESERLKRERAFIRARYPVLARYGNVTDLRALQDLKDDEALLRELGSQMPGILTSIQETRNNVLNGKLSLWSIPSLIDSTIAGLGINDEKQRGWIKSEKESRAKEETRDSIILAVFQIGFSIGAMFITGPAGIALATGAFGLGLYDAIQQTDQYFVQGHAANTHLDPAMSLLPPEMAAGWGWLVVAWVGVLLDAKDVSHSVAKAVSKVGSGTTSIAAAADELARASGKTGDEASQLAAKLRRAAAEFGPGEVITHGNKGALANRIGTSIEIDASLPHGEVRVYYKVDKAANRIEVLECKAHPAALAADVAAHAGVVRLLRRYDGVLGRFRQLWDRFREILGVTSNVPPSSLQRGSEAWESFHELSKHEELIAARTKRLGESVTAAEEAALESDVEFFESEFEHHARVVDQAAEEAGKGYIAAAGRRTREALVSGYRLPDFPDIAPTALTDEMLEKSNYYYRAADKPGEFTLVKKANRNVPTLRGNPDGTFTAGTPTRAERAAQLVAGWSKDARESFKALDEALQKVDARLVPVEGMAATGKTMREVIAAAGPANFEQAFLDILVEAQVKRGVAADAAKAAAQGSLQQLLDHPITVIQGTDQLRAFGYRSHYATISGAVLQPGEDLHHLVPLYLGGGHLVDNFVRLDEELHRRMHRLIDEIAFDEATTLAPQSIQKGALTFKSGAAILHPNGAVEILSLPELVRRAAQIGGG